MDKIYLKWYTTSRDKVWETVAPVLSDSSQDTLELTGEKFQTVDGFGGCFNDLGWIPLSRIPESEKEKIIEELFHPVRINAHPV